MTRGMKDLSSTAIAGEVAIAIAQQSPYIADFACVKEKLVIEVDGIGHAEPDEIARDAKRTAYLENLGWSVVRFMNVDVFDETDAVVESIWHHLKRKEPA